MKGVIFMFKKAVKFIVGTELVGCAVLSVICYGKAQYYKGRIDLTDEILNANKTNINIHTIK